MSKSSEVVGVTEEKETILTESEDRPLDETLLVGTRAIRGFNVGEKDDIDGDKDACLKSKALALC